MRRLNRNPRDESLLNKITIRKVYSEDYNRYDYYVKLDGEVIGRASVYGADDEVYYVRIDDKYKRKGITSYLYDYIEKDRGIKLSPSLDLTIDGKAFWENRLKRNPTDYQLIKRLKVKKYENPLNSGFYWYDVYLDEVKPEKLIGEFGYQKDRNYISTVGIHSDFQRYTI